MARNWTRDELILAMNLYCQLPFGKLHKGNPGVIELADALDRTPSSVAMKLCNIASLDPYHSERGVRGLSGASNLDRQIWDEFHQSWETLVEESDALRVQYGLTDSIDPLNHGIPSVIETEVVAEVRVRRGQRFFRNAILASYRYRCCITDIETTALLIASHILPWSSHPDHRVDPSNGLCLNVLHDKAFDRGLISFDEDWRLIISIELREATTNFVLNHSFLPFEGRVINLPHRFRPESSFMEVHRSHIYTG